MLRVSRLSDWEGLERFMLMSDLNLWRSAVCVCFISSLMPNSLQCSSVAMCSRSECTYLFTEVLKLHY